MTGRMLIMAMAVACASCGGGRPSEANQSGSPTENQPVQTPTTNPEAIKPGDPGGLPDDRTLVSEGTIDPKGAQGAGQVLQLFGGLLEQRQFAEAYNQWSDGGRASGMTKAQFMTAYDKYGDIHSQVGAPGPMEGAAGSAYVEIPFRLYGKLKTGEPFNFVGPVTLRRVNDVPGSTAEQRNWHIYRSEVKPRP